MSALYQARSRHVVELQSAEPTFDQGRQRTAGQEQREALQLPKQLEVTAGTRGFGPCSTAEYANDPAFLEFSTAAGYRFVTDADLLAEGFKPKQIAQMHKESIQLTRNGTTYRADTGCANRAIGYDADKLADHLVRWRVIATSEFVDNGEGDAVAAPRVLKEDPYRYFRKCLELLKLDERALKDAFHESSLRDIFIGNPDKRFAALSAKLDEAPKVDKPSEGSERARARREWFHLKRQRPALAAQYRILETLRGEAHREEARRGQPKGSKR